MEMIKLNYDDWHRLYREEEDYEYLEYVDNELKRLKRRYDRNESKRTIRTNK